jgi:LacI family transcriptional regulator
MTERKLPQLSSSSSSPVTIRDVARRANVSQATAARAMGGYGYVSDDRRRRVEQAAQELGYRPNSIARALVSGTTKTIGLVVGDIENPFFATLARGVADVVEAEGYTLLLANSDENAEREHHAVEAFRTRLVDGVIIAPVSGSDSAYLRQTDWPFVCVDRSVRGVDVDTITVTNERGARDGVEHLLSLGHRRIGVVTDTAEIPSTAQRLRGYRSALRRTGVIVDDALVSVAARSTLAGGHAAALELLSRPDRVHAVFTTSNLMTAGTVRALTDLGLRMPDDVALVAFDDLEWTTIVQPPITVVAQPVLELGTMAGRRILARLAGDSSPAQKIRLPTQLIVRGSCGEPGGKDPITLAPLTDADLDAVVAWRYPADYSVYDGRAADRDMLRDPANNFLAIRRAGEFLGHVCTGVEARVPGMSADSDLVDIGIGLAPGRVGRGESRTVVPAVLTALEQLLGTRVAFRATVAEWNGRAQAAVTRADFRPAGRHVNDNGAYLLFVRP